MTGHTSRSDRPEADRFEKKKILVSQRDWIHSGNTFLLLGPSEILVGALIQFFSPFVNSHQKEKKLDSFRA
jgi:hypothetical protein